MKRLKCLFLMLACVTAMGLCGCDYVELTEEETNRIAEYMAGKLLEYDRYYEEKLIRDPEESEEIPEVVPEETPEPETVEPEPEETKEPENPAEEETNEPKEEDPSIPVEEFFKKDGIQLTYKKCDIHQSYPDSDKSTDFIVEAEKGKQILVVHTELTNISGKENELSMIQKKYTFSLEGKDGSVTKPMMTFLVQDLQYYEAVFEKGEKKQTVLLFSIDKNDTQKGKKLIIEKDEKRTEITL